MFAGIPVTQILKLTLDSKGWVWVTTPASGAYVIDPLTDKVILHFGTGEPEERRMAWDGVATALEYDDSTMVLGANGIYIYNRYLNKITDRIDLPDNIPGTIAAIERDKQGYLWVSMTSGLFRVNPRNKIFVQFDRTDGMLNDFFLVASSYQLPDGRLLFGTSNHFILFNPAEVSVNQPPPDITITDIQVMNKSFLVDSIKKLNRLRLRPDNNSLAIEFSGLSYNGSYMVKYMMENLDKEWITADADNHAVYSYLPSGKYRFLVKSQNADGEEGKNITSLDIFVQPHFYETWWFLGLLALISVGVLYFLDRLRLQKLRATQSIRNRIASSLTEDMSNSLSSINISSELAKRKIDTDRLRAREYINQISDTSNRMVQAMSDMVWSINPESDTMADVIDRMKVYAAEFENSCKINVEFTIDRSVSDMKIDMEVRYELLSIYKEAICNASRHSSGRHVQVVIRKKDNRLIMLIEDDGKGFDVDSKPLSRGINDMRRRASAINASLYIESNINTGTIIKLEIPL
jgi:two-component sensor histidine kinase